MARPPRRQPQRHPDHVAWPMREVAGGVRRQPRNDSPRPWPTWRHCRGKHTPYRPNGRGVFSIHHHSFRRIPGSPHPPLYWGCCSTPSGRKMEPLASDPMPCRRYNDVASPWGSREPITRLGWLGSVTFWPSSACGAAAPIPLSVTPKAWTSWWCFFSMPSSASRGSTPGSCWRRASMPGAPMA